MTIDIKVPIFDFIKGDSRDILEHMIDVIAQHDVDTWDLQDLKDYAKDRLKIDYLGDSYKVSEIKAIYNKIAKDLEC